VLLEDINDHTALASDVDSIDHTKQMRQSMIEQRIQNGETGCQTGVCAVQCLESLRAEISTARDLGWYKFFAEELPDQAVDEPDCCRLLARSGFYFCTDVGRRQKNAIYGKECDIWYFKLHSTGDGAGSCYGHG